MVESERVCGGEMSREEGLSFVGSGVLIFFFIVWLYLFVRVFGGFVFGGGVGG